MADGTPCAVGGTHMKKLYFLVLLPLLGLPLFAQDTDLRGLKTVVGQLEGQSVAVGRQYAVLIAIDRYNNWMALRNPVKDAKEIKEILSRRYYISDFIELYDAAATKSGIIRLFDKLINETKPEDSIFLFYAGHGHLDKSSNTGFWIPVDGGTDVYDQANWLPNSQIRGFISNLKARHVALIADACFSGDFLNPSRGMAPTITNEYFKNAYARISRQVLTSGASEAVPDESPFTRQLKLTLEGSNAPYLDPLMLYNEIRLSVTKTTPLFGDLKDSGHQEGSSFLFFLKNNPPVQQAAAEPSASMKVAKIYGTATVETDASGTLFLDGISQGQVPVGSLATIENLAAGPHAVEMLFDDGQKDSQTVNIKMGKTSAVEFIHPTVVSHVPAAAAPKSLAQPLALLEGGALPAVSIKIDGSFDDWQSVPPVALGSRDAADNKSISRVYLAADAENFYVRLDIADTRSSSSHNFDAGMNSPFYAINMDSGDSKDNINLRLVHEDTGHGWFLEWGVREKGTFRGLYGSWYGPLPNIGQFMMKGSSVEVAVPLAKIKALLGGPGSLTKYRIFGWYARGWTGFGDMKQTVAGYFTFPENSKPPTAPAPKSIAQPLALLDGGPLPAVSIKIDGSFDDWQSVPPVVLGSRDATDNKSISRVCLAVDAENFYVRLDIADTRSSSSHNFDTGLNSPFYAINMDNGDSKDNINLRLVHEDTGHGWFLELGVREKGSFRHLNGHYYLNLPIIGQFDMKGSSIEAAIPLARIKSLLKDLGSTEKYRIFGWTANGWDTISGVKQTEAGYFTFPENSKPPTAAAPKSLAQPLALLDGGALPNASIKIDGSFDDWQSVPPVVLNAQNATDISAVSLAADSQNFYIKLDIADMTASSFLHPDNFKKMHDSPSYGITIDNSKNHESLSVRLFYLETWNTRWEAQMGVIDKGIFRRGDQGFRFVMKGSSAEIAIPLDKIKDLLTGQGPADRYRLIGWTAKGGLPSADSGVKADRNWTNALDDFRQTDAGFFTF